jgi:hypothetical protein
MHDYTGNNWSHWNSNERFKEKDIRREQRKDSQQNLL